MFANLRRILRQAIIVDLTWNDPTESFCAHFALLSATACFLPTSRLAYSSSLKMGVTCSSETSLDFQWTTWHYIQENRTLFTKPLHYQK
jgi:hypothetical protein